MERLLDGMLAEYGKAEPRFGLENRVLANLETEKARIAGRRRWWWILGTVSAAAVVAATVWMDYRPPDQHGAFRPANEAQRAQSAPAAMAAEVPSEAGAGVSVPTHPIRSRISRAIRPDAVERVATATTPKLEQFPTPAPLSEQERILARYVAEYSEQAVLVARAQMSLEQQEQREKSQRSQENSSSSTPVQREE
jgi:hypothetical protein